MNNMREYENKYIEQGYKVIAGTDEAGRGPLVGPVVCACVVLPNDYNNDEINDSKKLTEKKREKNSKKYNKSAYMCGSDNFISSAVVYSKINGYLVFIS